MKRPDLIVIGLDGAVPSHIMRLAADGELPAFKELIDRGCWFTDCRPAFPSITPSCWASISTGAFPATHGATDQDIHIPGTPLDQVVSAYHSANIRAERFWEAAARIGKKSLIMQMPTSGPAKADGVFQVAGAGCAAIGGAFPNRPTIPAMLEVPAQMFDSIGLGSGQIDWVENELSNPIASLHADVGKSSIGILPFSWTVRVGDGFAILADAPRQLDRGVKISKDEWSATLERVLECKNGPRRFRYRAKLLRSDGGKRHIGIFFTQMGLVEDVTSPVGFREAVASVPGVPANYGHSIFLHQYDDGKSYLEAEKMNQDWQWKLMKKTWESQSIDITVTYTVYLDTINHRYRNIIEGLERVSEKRSAAVASFYDDAYRLADSYLQKIIDYCDEDVTCAVVSDHGSVGYETSISPFDILEKHDLLFYQDSGNQGERKVDWRRTVAYPVGSCHVYVNLKDREPLGVVGMQDYEQTVRRIIRALQDGYWDARREVSALAIAVPNREAGILGLGGELSGDVVYGLSGSTIGGHIGGVHACQIPTAKTQTGDIRSLLLIAGPAFKQGAVIDRAVSLADIAPTLNYAMKYPQPRDADGGVVFQALRENHP